MTIIKKIKDYFAAYTADHHSNQEPESRRFNERVNEMQGSLVSSLQKIGLREGLDFKVSWDISEFYHVCGTIFQRSLLSRTVPKAVLEAFSSDKESEYWLCHFCVSNPETLIENEFYIRGNGDIVILKIEGWKEIRERLMSEAVPENRMRR